MFNTLFLILTGLILFTGCFVTEASDETADASTSSSSSGAHLSSSSGTAATGPVNTGDDSSSLFSDDGDSEPNSSVEDSASSGSESYSTADNESSTDTEKEPLDSSSSLSAEIDSSDASTECDSLLDDAECITNDDLEATLERCTDDVDNDLDGTVDCDDTDCWMVPGVNCGELSVALCSDELDNDNDGQVDCDDADCLVYDMCPYQNSNAGGGDGTGDQGTGGGDGDGDGGGPGGRWGVKAECYGKSLVLERFKKFTMTVYDHDQNTDFGNGAGADLLRQGMVTDKLINGRPEFKNNLWNNENIAQWWSADYAVSVTNVDLIFAKTDEATYSYIDENFFPLDSSGDENLNYYFAGHLQWRFTYDGQRGQNFMFSGDDDTFVYINGNLVLDIGGVHTPKDDEFILDEELDKLDLRRGDDITIDFFIAERQKAGSQAVIHLTIPCISK